MYFIYLSFEILFIIVVLYLLDKLKTRNEKLEMRNEKLEMIICQYNLLFLNFLFVNNIIMSSQGNNISLLKQLPFYGKTIKSKKFTNAKLLSELPFFKMPIKAKIKQLTTKKLLSEQQFYKQPIKKTRFKKLTNQDLLGDLPFYDDINILRNERTFRGYAENYKVEIINNRNLSDLLSVIKNSIKNLFDDGLRKK